MDPISLIELADTDHPLLEEGSFSIFNDPTVKAISDVKCTVHSGALRPGAHATYVNRK